MKKIVLPLILLLATTAFGQIPTSGLVGWWPFTGNAVDSVAQNNNATVYGATLATDRHGNSKSAYYFDGSGDYMVAGTHSSLRSSTPSVNFWFRYTDTSDIMKMVNNFNSIGSGEYGFDCSHSDWAGLHASGGAGSSGRLMAHLSHKRMNDNDWHMFTAIYNISTNQILMYIDGCLSGYQNFTGSKGGFSSSDSVVYKSSEPWVFGASSEYISSGSSNGPRYFTGYLDDIRMYNRPLRVTEIQALLTEGIKLYDTVRVVTYDTMDVYDTTFVYQYDTIVFMDTLVINTYDTSYINIFDTTFVTVNDTNFVSLSTTDTLEIMVKWLGTGSDFNLAKVYPNPTRDKVVVDLGDYLKLNGHKVIVNSAVGQKLFEQNVTSRYMEIDLNNLGPKGTYVLLFADKTGYIVAVKYLLLQ